MPELMKAKAATEDGMEVVELPVPEPEKNEVRVRVIAAAVNPADLKVVDGAFGGRFIHAKTDPLVVGWDFAGTIDATGSGVDDLETGTPVWGHLAYASSQEQGSFAEYITIPHDELAVKPGDLPYHVAAAAATVTLTGLQSLRDQGELEPGGSVLIIGAGGGVGSVSVGIAGRLGGQVTGVCSSRDVERVQSLGADNVIDRKKSNFLDGDKSYDVVFDTPAAYSYGRCAKILREGGTYVTTLPGPELLTGKLRSLFSSKKCRFVTVKSRREDLELIGRWLGEGLEVPIDSRFYIAELESALERQSDRTRTGRVVVDVAEGWPD